MKGKVCGFVAFDNNNKKYYDRFIKSLRKFHSEEELPIFVWDENKIKSYNDPQFFYRQKPVIGRQLLKKYDLVIGFDVDQIITGSLDYIINDESYDIAAPLNWNRAGDPLVTVWDVHPTKYLNCGLVAMRSREFVEKWFRLCFSSHFNSYQFREQDLLNILANYFDWKVKNLDMDKYWCGLISKAEFHRFEVKNGKLICPPAPDKFPEQEMEILVLHMAGGNVLGDKFDYMKSHCSEEVIDFINKLTT